VTVAAPTEPAVRVEGLVRRFGARTAVDGLSFEVGPGETFGLLGHNGAGKTTTIRLLNGVLSRDAGQISVLGIDPATHGERVRARTGVLTETPSLDERLTAVENLEFYGRLYGVTGSRLREQSRALLEVFDLTDRANERVARYSRGMKQRLALARTLVHDPDLLFLDEPTAALDPVAAREVHELVERSRRDERRTVILCTHNLVEAERLCDRVAIMRNGTAIAVGSPSELARSIQAPLTVEVEVDPADRERAIATLAEAGFGRPASTRAGVTFRAAGREAIPTAVAALVRAGVPVFRVANTQPDLEAVYFALYGSPEPADEDPAR
jgi:ABC-2 type transport system ATP-binding protein